MRFKGLGWIAGSFSEMVSARSPDSKYIYMSFGTVSGESKFQARIRCADPTSSANSVVQRPTLRKHEIPKQAGHIF
jgi:hypothetical protein